MPVVGDLLRLSSGREPVGDAASGVLLFRYLVLDTNAASPELIAFVQSRLDVDLLASGDGKELYAVQGVKSAPPAHARRKPVHGLPREAEAGPGGALGRRSLR
jgi:hypothetical protein